MSSKTNRNMMLFVFKGVNVD